MSASTICSSNYIYIEIVNYILQTNGPDHIVNNNDQNLLSPFTQFRVVKKEKKKIKKRRRSLDLSSHSAHRVQESAPKGIIPDLADDEAVRTVMYNVSIDLHFVSLNSCGLLCVG